MPRNKSGSANGGVIGVTNKTSFGKDTQTTKTSSGSVTLQSGTRIIQTLLVGGGGSGSLGASSGNQSAGGGGGGGLRNLTINANGTVPITIGGGGASTGPSEGFGVNGSNTSIVGCGTTYTSAGGGGGGRAGGSGGGGGVNFGCNPEYSVCGSAGNTPPVSPPQGN